MHYEFVVVPYELNNEPFFFMCIMNGIFRNYLDMFFIAFLDDIIIYSKLEVENEYHVIGPKIDKGELGI